MKVTLDRFEDNYALCEKEDKTMIKILRSLIPKEAREGSVLLVHENSYTLLDDEQKHRMEHINKLMDDLWE